MNDRLAEIRKYLIDIAQNAYNDDPEEELRAMFDATRELLAMVDELESVIADVSELIHRMFDWCGAYPIGVFPEPDLKLARKGLESVGITMDSVSASCMRHVLNGMTEYVNQAQAILNKSNKDDHS